MPRYAAVDIGSNSVRMMVAEAGAGIKTQILAEDRQVTRLGSSVFSEGRVSQEALQFLSSQLTRMAGVFNKLEISAIRAVATSAVRDSNNQGEFLETTQAALGSPIEVISGQEEARLIHLGVQARWPQPEQRVLIVDVGGGSTEFILADRGAFECGYSKPLGAVRLAGAFLHQEPPEPMELHQMAEYIDEKLAEPVKHITPPFHRVIATSATAAAIVCAVNKIPRAKRDEADRLSASTAEIRRLYEELSQRDLAARRSMPGIGPRRAEVIVAGTAVFLRTLEAFQHGSLYYSAAGVRDGIIADLATRRGGKELSRLSPEQRRVVAEMAERYGVQPAHARQVANLAHELFVSLQPLHKLPQHYGKLLEAAGYLHDIGHFVSNTAHHKHSFYLVSNADLSGFTDSERHVVAVLARYHRRTNPTQKHSFFQSVAPAERRAVMLLTPVLRLADSLDRSHEQRVRELTVELRAGQVFLELHSDTDTDLELWAAQRIAEQFRTTYNMTLSLAQTRR